MELQSKWELHMLYSQKNFEKQEFITKLERKRPWRQTNKWFKLARRKVNKKQAR